MICASTIYENVARALAEDLNGPAGNDITSQLIRPGSCNEATIVSRDSGIFCGRPFVEEVFNQLGGNIQIDWEIDEGQMIQPDQLLCRLSGTSQVLLTGERTALNFIQTLSAIATTTRYYAIQLDDTHCRLMDTRKTLPGLRMASKYAVLIGGGYNHRAGLYDSFLIKENHIAAYGSIIGAICQARENAPEKKIEVEVRNLGELKQAVEANCDIIMLDNFTPELTQEAVFLNQRGLSYPRPKIEVSGNITLETIRDYAMIGVDFISVGALTKNIQALDISMIFK